MSPEEGAITVAMMSCDARLKFCASRRCKSPLPVIQRMECMSQLLGSVTQKSSRANGNLDCVGALFQRSGAEQLHAESPSEGIATSAPCRSGQLKQNVVQRQLSSCHCTGM